MYLGLAVQVPVVGDHVKIQRAEDIISCPDTLLHVIVAPDEPLLLSCKEDVAYRIFKRVIAEDGRREEHRCRAARVVIGAGGNRCTRHIVDVRADNIDILWIDSPRLRSYHITATKAA
jgi:hypothetical protein